MNRFFVCSLMLLLSSGRMHAMQLTRKRQLLTYRQMSEKELARIYLQETARKTKLSILAFTVVLAAGTYGIFSAMHKKTKAKLKN